MNDRMKQYEWSRDDGENESSARMRVGIVRDGAEKNVGVRELQMQIEFNTETEFKGRDR